MRPLKFLVLDLASDAASGLPSENPLDKIQEVSDQKIMFVFLYFLPDISDLLVKRCP